MVKAFIKKFLPRTLFGRSLLILVTPVLLIQVFTTYMFFDRHWEKMTNRLAFAVAGEIAMISDAIEGGASEQELAALVRSAAKSLDLNVIYEPGGLLQKQDRRHAGWGSVVADTLSGTLDALVRRPYDIDLDIREKWVKVRVQLKGGVLDVISPQRRLFSSSGYIFLLWMIGSSILLLAIAILFMRNQIRPIRRLAIAAERFGKGRDVPFFKLEGAREVRQAARAFLDMRERINRQMQQRTAMLAGVSHDLRTPLTRMKLQVEMMSGPDAKDLREDIADMERMINAYLQFARGEGDEPMERVDLSGMLERVAAGAGRDGASIEVTAEPDLSLMLRPVAFERCLGNLIANAKAYGRHVWVAARRVGEAIEITIDDDGHGIPEELYEDVFKPFYRVEGSRNPKTGGVGLGLPIAQEIVHAHGGEIRLGKSQHGGLRVRIELPV